MKTVRIDRFGEPEVLRVIDVEKPKVQPDELLVRVHAAGVNFFEVLMRRDLYGVTPALPAHLGVEVAGVVEEVGADAGLRVGTRIAVPLFAFGLDGGYSEYVAVTMAAAIPLPDAVTFDDAVAVLVQGLTALYAIRQAPPKGKSVLVTAAAGGVGTLLVQLAKLAGAKRIIAMAGSDSKLPTTLALGADVAFNYSQDNWRNECKMISGGAGVDLAYDFVGGDLTFSITDVLAPQGQIVFGALGRFTLNSSAMNGLLQKSQTVRGLALVPLLTSSNVHEDVGELLAMVASGKLKVVVGGTFPLEAAADAHRLIESRNSIGKVVLTP